MKIKIFNSRISISDLELEINKFIEEENAEVISTTISILPMHDLFHDGSICNQWEEYTMVLIYK